ncbi:hypothetical protein R6Q57_003301 [Mikania cordata]
MEHFSPAEGNRKTQYATQYATPQQEPCTCAGPPNQPLGQNPLGGEQPVIWEGKINHGSAFHYRLDFITHTGALLVDDHTYFAHPINFQSGGYGRGIIVYFPFNNFKIYSHLDELLCVCLNHTSELLLWNPVTGAYKLLSTHDHDGFLEYNADAIGLYVDAYDDYKVLHIKRRCGVFIVSVYSRKLESWRNIPFISRPEFLNPSFSLSSCTFCGNTLYFTLCDCWLGGETVLLRFEVNSERFKEINFPPVASAGMTFGDLVNIENELYMFC